MELEAKEASKETPLDGSFNSLLDSTPGLVNSDEAAEEKSQDSASIDMPQEEGPDVERYGIPLEVHLTEREIDHAVYRFLLVRPRSVFTHLFPRFETYALLAAILISLAIQIILLLALDWNRESGPLEGRATGNKFVVSIFQSVSTRAAGFSTIDIAAASAAVKVTYVIFMYISSYPTIITLRSSSVGKFDSFLLHYSGLILQ